MAEKQEGKEITCQDPDDAKNRKTQSVNESEPVDLCPDVKNQCSDDVKKKTQSVTESKPADLCPDVKTRCSDDAPLSSTPVNKAPTNNCSKATAEEVNGEEGACLAEGDHLQNTVNKAADLAEGEHHGGYEGDSTKREEAADTIPETHSCPSGEDPTGNKTEPEAATLQILANGDMEEVDGPKSGSSEKSPAATDPNSEAEEDGSNVSGSEEEINKQENTVLPQNQKAPAVKMSGEQERYVETIGPTTTEASKSAISIADRTHRGGFTLLMAVGIVAIVAILVQHLLQPESPPPEIDLQPINIFLKQMENVKTQYPNQRAELWNRSKIHLKRHLQTSQPTEPVSLILTAGLRAERTLHCLAQSLASAFSSALKASVLHIDGASKAREDSDQVKLDIDSKLQRAFEGDKPVAVIHRFEELPPSSTLIFYRYCDHENAAYKKTFLIFTVLLGEEEEIPADTRLSVVEEMVDDHLQKKFLSPGHLVSFDRMDLDKYGGLWSRISHLILPVAAEERHEREGC
ncbi:torsin-1A-interacting protein 2 [Kryptolebias marmoratus]|uniref:Torsin-1A-interacting protein 2-like n=1 Tax=Kryptolebias marmoratus TaxID=37003 RepID=A0A3Q2ZFT4_KRYMA|nr:torsin-1A-interacting protein 2 [Kryptolebias marmoratus]